ncbi:alpha-L-arabinofuranosidase C-terminal domain-containing protein [Microbacterium panaciterrae]|uniref:non-reducing end alpha-L-arabinofuranosidase n=1 Tax=Microbacterium panaciterrae TaxID=985759 RepID=A0ABP8PQF7_9MICO
MVRLTIRDDLPSRPISPDLWGVFFEDINFSADGGLYAELVQNRSFEYTDIKVSGWGPLTAWSVDGDVELRTDAPLSESAPHYARIDAGSSLTNHGFDGISLIADSDYTFSVFARSANGGRLQVSLGTASESTAADVHINTSEWTRYEVVLHATQTAIDGTLSLRAEEDAIDVDLVSLFPNRVFRDSDNGMREDLAQAIADLRPRFVRFPGGCVSHGSGLDNMYRWPDTIGELQSRVPNFNVWGYHQSFGIGYLEYFRFCEQIGATALPVLAAGVCCQNSEGGQHAIPDEHMEDYIAEVLGLVEFANGDASTEWGARRTALGHPVPFGLRYLAIGNEDEITPDFRDRFARIYAALRETHPEIVVIGTVGPAAFGADYDDGWEFARQLEVPIVDEHSYKAPKWLFEHVDRYDSYDRSGPAVYLGEYGSKANRMLNALAEAAYMTGLERNGDIVKLASYAPLLAKTHRTQWTPDLIYFDNQRVMPSLNYHVQSMFSTTAGDGSRAVEISEAPTFVRPRQTYSTVAVEATGFRVAFQGVSLNGIVAPDVTADTKDGRVVLPLRSETADYVVRARATALERTTDHEIGFSLHFGAVGSPNSWEWAFGTWLNRSLTPYYTADGDRDELIPSLPFTVEIGREYEIEVRVFGAGERIEYLLDGELVQEYIDPAIPEQRFVATCITDSTKGRSALRIVNATSEERSLELELASGSKLPSSRVLTLTAPEDAGVPFEPSPAEPEATELPSGATLLIPPYSFAVLEWDDIATLA